jgi:hypothetical protein
MAQVFDKDQLHFISNGQLKQKNLRNDIDEALFHNPFNENFIISSLPGLGKSHETKAALQNVNPATTVIIEGSANLTAFTIDIATAVYLSKGQRLLVILDDCDMLFEDKNVNTAKKMFDQTRALKYNKNWRSLKGMCSDLQYEAIASFSGDDKAGFSVPTNNITFLTLTNRHLPTVNEVEAADSGSRKETRFTDLYAIRRRSEYKEIAMGDKDLWGYAANIVLNETICEKFKPDISLSEKEQILTWCYNNWSNVSERNLSLIEKMTKDMVRYPTDYLDIWKANYL